MRLNRAVRGRGTTSSSTTRRRRPPAPILRRHVVLVFVDQLDLAAARAIQYARTLDARRAARRALRSRPASRPRSSPTAWAQPRVSTGSRSSSSTAPTGGITAPRVEVVADDARRRRHRGERAAPRSASTRGSGTACCTTAPPTRSPRRSGELPHANVTFVPYHLGADSAIELRGSGPCDAQPRATTGRLERQAGRCSGQRRDVAPDRRAASPIADVEFRQHARLAGRVRSVRVQPLGGVPSLEVRIADETRQHPHRVHRSPPHTRHQARHPTRRRRHRRASRRDGSRC